jgi:potassium efflux system protein
MKTKKLLILLLLVCFQILPAHAVFTEKNLPQTLDVLKYELQSVCDESNANGIYVDSTKFLSHKDLEFILDRLDEYSLMLYSQNQEHTFDLTYACHEIGNIHSFLWSYRAPFLETLDKLEIAVDRFQRLKIALERLPNQPRYLRSNAFNKQMMEDRKVCLNLVNHLLQKNQQTLNVLKAEDDIYFKAIKMSNELSQYANKRYTTVQKKIFIYGQDSYFKILSHLPHYTKLAIKDVVKKYKGGVFNNAHSEWRGPMVLSFMLIVLLYLAVALLIGYGIIKLLVKKVEKCRTPEFNKLKPCLLTLAGLLIFSISMMLTQTFVQHNFFKMASSLLVEFTWILSILLASLALRLKPKQIRHGVFLYLPIIVMGFLIIACRIIFAPNLLVNLLFPPIILVFCIWQASIVFKQSYRVPQSDMAYASISLLIMIVATVFFWSGYVLLGLVIMIWWIFQLAVIHTITTIYYLLRKYQDHYLHVRLRAHRIFHQVLMDYAGKGGEITITWFFDLVRMTVLPVLTIFSIPFCIFLAAGIFELSELCKFYYNMVFLNVNGLIQLSANRIALVLMLFFIFLYINYASTSFYHYFKVLRVLKATGSRRISAQNVNLTLADNVIRILIWGIFIITAMVIFNIPKEGISIAGAGLVTGLSFAMKDIVNNFYCGVQLMSGRMKVGDYIECDGIRGKVESITYQAVQVLTLEGNVIVFLNSQLFNKNFKNLTRNHDYEYLIFNIGVIYGTDIEEVRSVVLEAIEPIADEMSKGRRILDPEHGVSVELSGFDHNQLNIRIKAAVLVEKEIWFSAKSKELIYNALNAKRLGIPYPEGEVHVVLDHQNKPVSQ